MLITRSANGVIHISGRASDGRLDGYQSRMAPSLFKSFLHQFSDGERPQIDVAHLGATPIGITTSLSTRRSGRELWMEGDLEVNPLTNLLLERSQDGLRLGLSIAFDPLGERTDGEGHQVFTDGVLRGLAITSSPANLAAWVSRISPGRSVMRSALPLEARLKDAQALLGSTFAEWLVARENEGG